jgi:hypothetical protein
MIIPFNCGFQLRLHRTDDEMHELTITSVQYCIDSPIVKQVMFIKKMKGYTNL